MNCEKNDDLPFGKMYICAGPHFLSHCSASWVSEMSYTAIAVYKKTSGFEEIKFSVYDEFKVELILIPLQPALAWEALKRCTEIQWQDTGLPTLGWKELLKTSPPVIMFGKFEDCQLAPSK